jgi:hypothetical protein
MSRRHHIPVTRSMWQEMAEADEEYQRQQAENVSPFEHLRDEGRFDSGGGNASNYIYSPSNLTSQRELQEDLVRQEDLGPEEERSQGIHRRTQSLAVARVARAHHLQEGVLCCKMEEKSEDFIRKTQPKSI